MNGKGSRLAYSILLYGEASHRTMEGLKLFQESVTQPFQRKWPLKKMNPYLISARAIAHRADSRIVDQV